MRATTFIRVSAGFPPCCVSLPISSSVKTCLVSLAGIGKLISLVPPWAPFKRLRDADSNDRILTRRGLGGERGKFYGEHGGKRRLSQKLINLIVYAELRQQAKSKTGGPDKWHTERRRQS